MKSKAQAFLIVSFLAAAIFGMVWHNLHKPRLLVLHSYHEDYAWVRDVNAGIERIIKGTGNEFFVRRHYLDNKRHPDAEHKRVTGLSARRMIDEWRPDVVIAVDDDAQEYAAKYYGGRPGISVVFAGVNRTAADYGYDKASNVTGILERLPLDAIREALATFAAEKDQRLRIFFVGDLSDTVRGDEKWVSNFNWDPVVLAGTRLAGNLEEWRKAIETASAEADYILVSNYRQVQVSPGSDDLVPPEELIKMTVGLTKKPVIGANSFFIDDGGMVAIATSALEQGEEAAKMALEILKKKKRPGEIPIQTSRHFVVAVDGGKVAQARFPLPRIYEECARISNYYRE